MKRLYEKPSLRMAAMVSELGFALSAPAAWDDANRGSADFGVKSDYDNEFE